MTEPTHSPEVVPVPDGSPARELRLRVRERLAGGELVALPTETVYGIAARADDPAALERLRVAKGRDPELHFTWHVPTRDAVEHFEELRPLARRLTERYWPGPLTLVLAGAPPGLEHVTRDGWTGVRLPAHRATQAFLEAVPFPVVMSSANRSGETPLSDAASVAETFGEELALVVDGGPARLREASGVLRLGRGHFELLRAGLLPVEDLRRVAGLRIAFVCTGNTCRSPMAEGLARDLLAQRLGGDPVGFGFEVTSMGVAAGPGSPAARHAVDVLAQRGIDLAEHYSRPATLENLRALDHVYCLTRGHLEALRSLVPPGAARCFELLDPKGEDVPDPIGGSRRDYEDCAASILRSIELRAETWA